MRTIASILFCTLALTVLVNGTVLGFPQEDQASSKEIEKLIVALGDDDFVVRENASSKLLEIGESATKLLKKAAKAPDSEVRFQVKRLLRLIEITSYKRRLEKFLASKDPKDDFGLAGWKKFSGILGQDRNSRKLFVELHENLPGAMKSLDKGNTEIDKEFRTVMSSEINAKYNLLGINSRPIIRALICSMILSVVHTNNKGNSYSMDSQIGNRLQDASLKDSLKSGALHVQFKAIIIHWLNKSEKYDSMTPRRMYIAQSLGLPKAGLSQALLCLKSNTRVSSSYLGQAILFVGKNGSKEHLPLLYKFIDNNSSGQRAYMLTKTNSTKTVVPKISDHTIEAYSAILKWEPKEFGMYEIQHNSNYYMNSVLPGFNFESTTKRKAGIKKFKEKVKKTAAEKSSAKKTSSPKSQKPKSTARGKPNK